MKLVYSIRSGANYKFGSLDYEVEEDAMAFALCEASNLKWENPQILVNSKPQFEVRMGIKNARGELGILLSDPITFVTAKMFPVSPGEYFLAEMCFKGTIRKHFELDEPRLKIIEEINGTRLPDNGIF